MSFDSAPGIDAYIEHRNRLQLEAESRGGAAGAKRWIALGVANRHIERVLKGEQALTDGVRKEIEDCLARTTESTANEPD